MSTETSAWERVQRTRRNPDTKEYHVSRKLPFGLLERIDTHWTNSAPGAIHSHYDIGVTEHRPHGKIADVLESELSMSVILAKSSPAWEEHSAMRTTYIASLVAGELVSVHGHIVELDTETGNPVRLEDGSRFSSMNPDEALRGFEAALDTAHF